MFSWNEVLRVGKYQRGSTIEFPPQLWGQSFGEVFAKRTFEADASSLGVTGRRHFLFFGAECGRAAKCWYDAPLLIGRCNGCRFPLCRESSRPETFEYFLASRCEGDIHARFGHVRGHRGSDMLRRNGGRK